MVVPSLDTQNQKVETTPSSLVTTLAGISLTIPLLFGCRSTDPYRHENCQTTLAETSSPLLASLGELTPKPGQELVRVEYDEGSLIPIFAPIGIETSGFTDTDLRILGALLNVESGVRNVGVKILENDYSPRFAPVLFKLAVRDSDLEVSDIAASILRRNEPEYFSSALCARVQIAQGIELERGCRYLYFYKDSTVVDALYNSLLTSGIGFKEPRDPGNFIGQALLETGRVGEERVRALLQREEPELRLAAAAALATRADREALLSLVGLSASDDQIVRSGSIAALKHYPDSPVAIEVLARALYQREHTAEVFATLSELGAAGSVVLLSVASPEQFVSNGLERDPLVKFGDGITYGAVAELLVKCRSKQQQEGVFPSDLGLERAYNEISTKGISKLIEDLRQPALKSDAFSALTCMPEEVVPVIAQFADQPGVFVVLKSFGAKSLLPLVREGSSSLSDECAASIRSVLAASIRDSETLEQFRENLLGVFEAPTGIDYSWLRTFLSESCRTTQHQSAVSEILDDMCSKGSVDVTLASLKDELDRAAKLGISLPLRWDSELLRELCDNREAQYFDGRPIATVVYTIADHNGAFEDHDQHLRELSRRGYCVMYFDASTDLAVIDAIRGATARAAESECQPAKLLILGAHSSSSLMNFGDARTELATLGIEDKDQLIEAGLGSALVAGGQIIVIGCSTGEGRDKGENIANLLRTIFPHAKEQGIWTPEVPDNVRWITYSTSGEIEDVQFFKSSVYRP